MLSEPHKTVSQGLECDAEQIGLRTGTNPLSLEALQAQDHGGPLGSAALGP